MRLWGQLERGGDMRLLNEPWSRFGRGICQTSVNLDFRRTQEYSPVKFRREPWVT